MSDSSNPRRAEIVVIGDEILTGEVADENAFAMARSLTALGIRVESIRFVPDAVEPIVAALGEAAASGALVLVSGGIGPTHDDVTREAVARVAGVRCTRHAEAEARLRAGYGDSITAAELGMADLPEGARLLHGRRTGVFGFGIGNLHVMPGVPHLLRDILDRLAEEWGGEAAHRVELETTLREGHIADALRALKDAWPDVSIGSYPYRTAGGYRLRLVLRSADEGALDGARAAVERLLEEAARAHP